MRIKIKIPKTTEGTLILTETKDGKSYDVKEKEILYDDVIIDVPWAKGAEIENNTQYEICVGE